MKWVTVKEVLYGALALEPRERGAFLAGRCGADPALLAEVEALLGSYEEEPGFMETPALDRCEGLSPSRCGERLGPYRLEQAIGQGGMGVVYSARRTDAYEQRVAVKLLRSGLGLVDPRQAAELERRFRSERQTLADLDHPNIARLLDGGTAADGTPYLVMEYVDGLPLDRHCAARGLATEDRLELFCLVCAAVQYAHQHLVVHRDLKPGNILTTAEGIPKLVDFGIAKLLETEAPGTTRTRTALMTPEYASPEQIRGESVSTASDVYSLGVVLYELLTGVRPHELGDVPHHEAQRILCEEEPEKPSTAADRRPSPGGASPARLKGDLDTIVLKALHRDARQRYGSVEQLAEDLRRHLAGLPVLARKDTLAYRSRKFVRRHWRGVAAAALLVLALAGGLAGTLWKEREARAEARTAEAVARFLVALFEERDPYPEGDPARLAGAALSADVLMRRARERVAADLGGEPGLQVRLLETLGTIHAKLGLHADARALFAELLALDRARLPAGDPGLVASLNNLATAHKERGDFAIAQPLFREAVALARGAGGPGLALLLMNHGAVLAQGGELEAAEETLAEALERAGEDEGETRALVLLNQADLHARRRDSARAAGELGEALELLRSELGPRHRYIAVALNNLGMLRHEQGRLDEAEDLLGEALEMRRDLFGRDHPDTAQSLNNVALLALARGDGAPAEALFRDALEAYEASCPAGHADLERARMNLGVLLYERGEPLRARPLFESAVAHLRAVQPGERAELAKALTGLGAVLTRAAEPSAAEPLLREALAIRRELPGAQLVCAVTESVLGECLAALGRYEEAEPLLVQSDALLERSLGSGHARAREARARLAALYEQTARPEEAAALRAR